MCVCVCVLSLLLRCGALTCSHHKQQSHHQSKEQVHLHFAVCRVLCQVPHSVSLCQCEVGELRRGLCVGSVPIFGNVVHLGVESGLLEPHPSALSVSWESVFMSWESQ